MASAPVAVHNLTYVGTRNQNIGASFPMLIATFWLPLFSVHCHIFQSVSALFQILINIGVLFTARYSSDSRRHPVCQSLQKDSTSVLNQQG